MAGFPNVPNVPGVPPLARSLGSVPALLALTKDVITFFAGIIGPSWGLFYNGLSVIDADSVVSFDYKKNWNIATFPLERGAFESYDKVEIPYDVRMRFASGGSEANRTALLTSVDNAAKSMLLFDAVTPEKVYTSCNINHFDYARKSNNGVGLIIVDVWLLQIRVSGSQAFSSTKSPSGAATADGGVVQPLPPTPTAVGSGEFF